jgi:hypothetical protein
MQIEDQKTIGKGIPMKSLANRNRKSLGKGIKSRSLAIRESKIPWEGNCKGIFAIANHLIQKESKIPCP